MKLRTLASFGTGVLALTLGGFGIWVDSLPEAVPANPPPVPAAETAAMLDALRPVGNERPVIAIIGINDATETTDYLMPTGILRRADIADVQLVAAEEGPVTLYPALRVQPDVTIADFDAAHPQGANYVIVPAMSRDDDPAVMAWLREQADKGSIIIAVCAGAKVAAAAGLLEGRRATTHWFYRKELLRENPGITYVRDRRIVVDGSIATTTGISASIPMALTLIEAIAGRAKAISVANEIGIAHWDAAHDSDTFQLTRQFATTVVANILQFWQREDLELRLEPDFDAVSLALVADAWSRTYRSEVTIVAGADAPLTDRDGIVILPDRVSPKVAESVIAPPGLTRPATALDQALDAIGARYGEATTNVVAMQLEYGGRTP